MPFSKAGQLARTVTTARLSDPIGLVAENLREAPYGVLPVLDRTLIGDQNDRNARVIGLITQSDLSKATQTLTAISVPPPVIPSAAPSRPFDSETTSSLAETAPSVTAVETSLVEHQNGGSPNGISSNISRPSNPQTLCARDIMRGDVPIIPSAFSLHNALLTLERYDFAALPVIDEVGRYIGLISRADVVSAISGNIRPPMVGGMATPFGVYLTDGRLSGGVSSLALFMTGLILSVCLIGAQLLLTFLAGLINPEWGVMSLSGRASQLSGDSSGVFELLATIGQSLLLFAIIRLLPLSGYHAAEHQTVHAIERGLPLEIEYVAKMPRAHPRCGTNLAILGSLMLIGFQHLPGFGPEYILPVLIFTFFFWRAFGTFIQEVFTTRPATKEQLQSGIDAAKELMSKYQAQPFAAPSKPLQLLNNAMIPMAGGMLLGYGVILPFLEYLARSILS
jgi:CBS domain-containing protein